MQTSIKEVLLATTLSCAAALSAPAANAQSSTQADEAQPVPMLQLSFMTAPARAVSLRPIREPLIGGTIGSPVAASNINADLKSLTGKLFVTIDGAEHYCTGLLVKEKIVITAAHCVQENGTANKYEVMGFLKEGNTARFLPQGDCVKVPMEWASITDNYLRVNYDYAFVTLATGVTAGDVKVHLNLPMNPPHKKSITAVGYPATKAGVLTAIGGESSWDALHPQPMHFPTTNVGFTEGTSGGAWVWESQGMQPLKLVSINSSYAVPIYDKSKIRIYGPDFHRGKKTEEDTSVSELLAAAETCN